MISIRFKVDSALPSANELLQIASDLLRTLGEKRAEYVNLRICRINLGNFEVERGRPLLDSDRAFLKLMYTLEKVLQWTIAF